MGVDRIEIAEAVAHEPHLELGAVGEGHQGQVRLGEIDVETAVAGILLGLEAHFGPRVGIDLAEEGDLDLAWEEEILQAGEAAALVLLDVVLGQVAYEVAGDAHIEKELAGAAPLVEREWLAGLDEVERRRL